MKIILSIAAIVGVLLYLASITGFPLVLPDVFSLVFSYALFYATYTVFVKKNYDAIAPFPEVGLIKSLFFVLIVLSIGGLLLIPHFFYPLKFFTYGRARGWSGHGYSLILLGFSFISFAVTILYLVFKKR